MIELRKITHDNFEAVLELKVSEEQKDFVSSPIYCLAESYVDVTNRERPPLLFAIYNGEEVIGYVDMGFYELGEDAFLSKKFNDKATYGINRFMIDEKHQGKGLGKAAMLKVIEFARTSPQGRADAMATSFWMQNDASRKFFASVGFIETGDVWDGETFERWDASRTDIENAELGARLAL
ncbi:MAG: GNAT family N-acetyltransferase [Defluviitaleaceae bacterium]|nr:GNAT family N-acetyltransferase [Defluviitaleaceae bacterium]